MSGRAPGWRGLDVIRGVLLLARFRPAGIERFGNGKDSLLSSLAPLIALPATFGLLAVMAGAEPGVLTPGVAWLDVLLVQLVVSESLARWWGRDAVWGRYATALNWSQWAMLPALAACTFVIASLVMLRVPPIVAVLLGLAGLTVYALVLQGFIARHGLGISAWRAALVVIAANASGAALLAIPTVRHWAIGGPPATTLLITVSTQDH